MSETEVVWIVGASTGIGRALATTMARQGKRVIASARTRQTLEQLQQEYPTLPISTVCCDVTDRFSLGQAAKKVQNDFSHVNTVIINAGICEYFSTEDPDWDMMRRVMKVNFIGAVNTLEATLPLLRKAPSKTAHVVAVGSLANEVPFSRAEAYGASKAALQYFFESLRVDLASENIAVTVVRPGFVDTPLTAKNDFPMPFMIAADKAAAIIANRLERKPKTIRFPLRLAALLTFFRVFSGLWYYLATKQLRRAVAPNMENERADEGANAKANVK